jgi:hypothetical protein
VKLTKCAVERCQRGQRRRLLRGGQLVLDEACVACECCAHRDGHTRAGQVHVSSSLHIEEQHCGGSVRWRSAPACMKWSSSAGSTRKATVLCPALLLLLVGNSAEGMGANTHVVSRTSAAVAAATPRPIVVLLCCMTSGGGAAAPFLCVCGLCDCCGRTTGGLYLDRITTKCARTVAAGR